MRDDTFLHTGSLMLGGGVLTAACRQPSPANCLGAIMQTSPLGFIEDALSTLEHAVHDRTSDLRNIQLATASTEAIPDVRTLVLRAFSRAPATAEMHTDIRTAKVQAIGGNRKVALLAWSDAEQLQLRFRGTAHLHGDDDAARDRWEKLSPNARGAYGTTAVPGSVLPVPGDRSCLPPDEQYRQFGVLLIRLQTVDVLRLGPAGRQTRARGQFDAAGMTGDWIAG